MADPILTRLKAALADRYGARLRRVVLFGSRARGDARPDSDYDVAIFLDPAESVWIESATLAEIETDLLLDAGVIINAIPIPIAAQRQDTAFLREVRRDGVEL